MNHLDSFMDAITATLDDEDDARARVRRTLVAPGARIGDRYLLRQKIARGGMSTIWEAEDSSLGRTVAIKFMSPEYVSDEEFRARFGEEARAAARLQTPFVARIHDHGVAEGIPYIVMERLVGEDLHQRMLRTPRLGLALAEKVASEAGRALAAAHSVGIVHRDLKPQNLFLAREHDVEIVKLLDFGVAKHAGTASLATGTGVTLGSPLYMSPEQIRCDRNIDERTDLWSLAAILYRALTGHRPFEGDLAAVMWKVVRERPLPPSAVCAEIGRAFDAFFEKGLSLEREGRFASANELVTAFEAAARDSRASSPSLASEPPISGSSVLRPSNVTDELPTSRLPATLLAQLSGELADEERPSGLRLGDGKRSRPPRETFAGEEIGRRARRRLGPIPPAPETRRVMPEVEASKPPPIEEGDHSLVLWKPEWRPPTVRGEGGSVELESSWLQISAGAIVLATIAAITLRILLSW